MTEPTVGRGAGRHLLRIRYLGGPTTILELGGVRLVTDPTFDAPGDYPLGTRTLTKTAGPVLAPNALGPVDAVLLSHDQHPDNLDRTGREYLGGVPLVLSTASARGRLGGAGAGAGAAELGAHRAGSPWRWGAAGHWRARPAWPRRY
jgi:hypothetical protein